MVRRWHTTLAAALQFRRGLTRRERAFTAAVAILQIGVLAALLALLSSGRYTLGAALLPTYCLLWMTLVGAFAVGAHRRCWRWGIVAAVGGGGAVVAIPTLIAYDRAVRGGRHGRWSLRRTTWPPLRSSARPRPPGEASGPRAAAADRSRGRGSGPPSTGERVE
jgi:hypothetical protein